jgi:putative proteasome-type protease
LGEALTYCLGIKVREGLIGLADGRITSGTQLTSARKVTLHGPNGSQFFIMTSGMRSLRDKAVAYLERDLKQETVPTMLDAVGVYTKSLRRVIGEDKAAVERSNLAFNLHAIIGGQLAGDDEPTMFLIYPECNWIQVDERTPYLSIGVTGYGKPILDRALHYDTPLRTAAKLAYLSFDSTRLSSSDVGFPLDLVTYHLSDRLWRERQYEDFDLREQGLWWNEHLTQLANAMPDGPWLDGLLP